MVAILGHLKPIGIRYADQYSSLQHIGFFAVAACNCGFFISAGRATRAGFAGWHVLDFDFEVLRAILRPSARGGIKSVTILLPVSCIRRYGPLIAAISGKAGQGTALASCDRRRLLSHTPFLY